MQIVSLCVASCCASHLVTASPLDQREHRPDGCYGSGGGGGGGGGRLLISRPSRARRRAWRRLIRGNIASERYGWTPASAHHIAHRLPSRPAQWQFFGSVFGDLPTCGEDRHWAAHAPTRPPNPSGSAAIEECIVEPRNPELRKRGAIRAIRAGRKSSSSEARRSVDFQGCAPFSLTSRSPSPNPQTRRRKVTSSTRDHLLQCTSVVISLEALSLPSLSLCPLSVRS